MELSGLETNKKRNNRPKMLFMFQISRICVCEDEEAVDYRTHVGNHQGPESGSHDKMTPRRAARVGGGERSFGHLILHPRVVFLSVTAVIRY